MIYSYILKNGTMAHSKASFSSSDKIDPLQLDLLKLFSARRMSSEELRDIKLLIANYYAQKADAELDHLFEENKWTVQEKVREWGEGHDRIKSR